jgi:predicted dehydrogenase
LKLIRVAVIGCGVIAQNVHIPAYIQNPKSKLVAICDSNTEQMEKVKKRYDIANTFSDYKELVDSDLVDAVTICTPSATHSEIALETIKHGIHTLCEKPLASTLSEGEKIAAAVRQGKAKFMVGFNYRFLPNHVMAKKFLDAGRIGKPIFIRGDLITAGPYRTETRERDYPYEVKKRIGALFDLGSHIADLFIWMMGQPREVYATFSSYKNTVNADDLATVLVKFESGVLGNINVTWLNLPDYQSTADNRIIEIVGTEGLIGSEFYGPSLFF